MNIPSMSLNKSEFWWCRKASQGVFDAPIRLMANIMPTNSDGDIVLYGEQYPEYLKIKGSIRSDLSAIKEGDKLFFRKDVPLTHDASQTTTTSSNFVVTSRPIIAKSTLEIILKRIADR